MRHYEIVLLIHPDQRKRPSHAGTLQGHDHRC
jgi:hypothetical protein